MSITIKTPEEIERMRIAGRLASEVLDYITPFIKPGITTAEIDRLGAECIQKKGKEVSISKRYLHSHVYCSTVHNSRRAQLLN